MPLKHIFAILLLVTSSFSCTINVIFDVGDVLVETDTMQALKCVGLKTIARYIAYHPTSITNFSTHVRQDLLFPFLRTLGSYAPGETPMRDERNTIAPAVMRAWQTGAESPRSILARAYLALKKSTYHPIERALMWRMMNVMFNPKNLVATRRLIDPMVAFAHECHAKGYKLYVLSNWDAQSFKLLTQRYPDLFGLFDGIVTSGECGEIKPNEKPYQYLMAKYNLAAEKSLFIDDLKPNVETALRLGMRSVMCKRQRGWSGKYVDMKPIRAGVAKLAGDFAAAPTLLTSSL